MFAMAEGKVITRRRFTPEFKAEAVKLVRESGKSAHTVAKDLGIVPTVVRRWVRQAAVDAGDNPQGALTTQEREELAGLCVVVQIRGPYVAPTLRTGPDWPGKQRTGAERRLDDTEQCPRAALEVADAIEDLV